jgi:hypothetical protein
MTTNTFHLRYLIDGVSHVVGGVSILSMYRWRKRFNVWYNELIIFSSSRLVVKEDE